MTSCSNHNILKLTLLVFKNIFIKKFISLRKLENTYKKINKRGKKNFLNFNTQKYPVNTLISDLLDFPQTFTPFSNNQTHFPYYFLRLWGLFFSISIKVKKIMKL